MRIDATISEHDGKQLDRLARKLGLSRSELIAEALHYVLRLKAEVDAGRRVVSEDPQGRSPARELVSRLLAAPPPVVPGMALHRRPSRSADGARDAELARLRALTPFERMAEALELGEDDLSPPGASP
jgi:hypothetical protein